MERTITGTVGEVQGRTVNTRYGEKTVFDITIGSQKTSTFKSDIAEEANALKGSTVDATVREEQRGDYTNYMLLGVKLVDAYPPAGGHQSAPNGTGGATTASGIPLAPATSPESRGGMSPEREAKIVRQSSMATAFNYAASAGLSEDEAFALAGRIFHKAMGTQSEGELVPVAAAPTETTEDIPW